MTGDAVFVPASLVYVARPEAEEPATNTVIYPGIAAGTSPEAAERAALEELIERNAVTLKQGVYPATLYKPYRPDRAYRDDFRPDFRAQRRALGRAGHRPWPLPQCPGRVPVPRRAAAL
jgi:ribosomal protein S12 methylthiotransferase accessory factor YcaO